METNKTNIETGRRFFESFNEKDTNTIRTLWAPDYKVHMGLLPGGGSPNDHVNLIETFMNAFPDIRITIEDIISAGDKVVFRGRATGTHRGEFQGIPASNKKVEITYIDLMEFSNGKIKNEYVEMDSMKLMQQIGAVPE